MDDDFPQSVHRHSLTEMMMRCVLFLYLITDSLNAIRLLPVLIISNNSGNSGHIIVVAFRRGGRHVAIVTGGGNGLIKMALPRFISNQKYDM